MLNLAVHKVTTELWTVTWTWFLCPVCYRMLKYRSLDYTMKKEREVCLNLQHESSQNPCFKFLKFSERQWKNSQWRLKGQILQRQCSKQEPERSFRLGFIVAVLLAVWSSAAAKLRCVQIHTRLIRYGAYFSSDTCKTARPVRAAEKLKFCSGAVSGAVTGTVCVRSAVRAVQYDAELLMKQNCACFTVVTGCGLQTRQLQATCAENYHKIITVA
jgi:hypothetical protein